MDTLHPLIPFPHLFFLRPYLGWGCDIDVPLWLSTPQTLILCTLICDESLRYLPREVSLMWAQSYINLWVRICLLRNKFDARPVQQNNNNRFTLRAHDFSEKFLFKAIKAMLSRKYQKLPYILMHPRTHGLKYLTSLISHCHPQFCSHILPCSECCASYQS